MFLLCNPETEYALKKACMDALSLSFSNLAMSFRVYSSISNKTKLAQKLYDSGYSCLQVFTESVLFISTHLKFQSRRLMYWPPFMPMLNENVSYVSAFIHPNNKSNILFLCICS